MPLSMTNNLSEMFYSLSDKTWGIKVSLQDLVPIEDKKSKKMAKNNEANMFEE